MDIQSTIMEAPFMYLMEIYVGTVFQADGDCGHRLRHYMDSVSLIYEAGGPGTSPYKTPRSPRSQRTSYGELAEETYTVCGTSIPNMVHGCGHNNIGIFDEQSTGMIGLGDGHLSFVG
ncbi:uncharacterized protein LOC124918215 [Impatiens glandulifera]|uniref:uncharacterized protein LOC124918215 n=1 Tax=Impatiens glandulifera TaxID=253017 RepID=UPI001FB0DA74|nr:uncharacterized protein LOC124918215 [Impatiens glandulifera]